MRHQFSRHADMPNLRPQMSSSVGNIWCYYKRRSLKIIINLHKFDSPQNSKYRYLGSPNKNPPATNSPKPFTNFRDGKTPRVMWIASSKGTSQVIIDSHASSWLGDRGVKISDRRVGWRSKKKLGNLQPSKFGKPRTTKHLKQKSPINLYSFLKIFLIPSWFFQFGCCLNLKVHGVCIGTPNIIPFSPSSRHSPRPSSQHSLQWWQSGGWPKSPRHGGPFPRSCAPVGGGEFYPWISPHMLVGMIFETKTCLVNSHNNGI